MDVHAKIEKHTEYIGTTRLQLGCTPEQEGFWDTRYYVGVLDAHEEVGTMLCVTPDFDDARRVYEDAAFTLRFIGNVHSLIHSHYMQLDMMA
jgi:hypothetical protein